MPTTTPAAVAGDADDFVESPAGPDSQDEFSRRLWDEAYEKIKADCPELVAKYEVILTRLLSPEPKDDANENRQREGAPVTEEASTKKLGFFRKGNVLKKQNPTIERNDIEQSVTDEGRAERRAQMHRIADHLMNKTQKTASVEEKAKAALDVATKFRDALTLGFDAIPGGEVAVAAFWTGLEVRNIMISLVTRSPLTHFTASSLILHLTRTTQSGTASSTSKTGQNGTLVSPTICNAAGRVTKPMRAISFLVFANR